MTRAEALADLTASLQARVNGIGLAHLGRGERPRIPAEMAESLAAVALDWAVAQGLSLSA